MEAFLSPPPSLCLPSSAPEAVGLQDLPWQIYCTYGGMDGGGGAIRQSSVSTITHNLEVKDAGHGSSANQFDSSLLPSLQASLAAENKAAPPGCMM